MRYFLYNSTSNTAGLDAYVSFSEIDDEGHWARYIEISQLQALKYDRIHPADKFGVLPEGKWDDAESGNRKYGSVTVLDATVFESAWASIRTPNAPPN